MTSLPFSAIIAGGMALGASLGVTSLASCDDSDADIDAGFAQIDASVRVDGGE